MLKKKKSLRGINRGNSIRPIEREREREREICLSCIFKFGINLSVVISILYGKIMRSFPCGFSFQ